MDTDNLTKEEIIEEVKRLQFERGKKDASKNALPRQATIYYLRGYLEGKEER